MVAYVKMGGKPKAPAGYDEWATTKVNIAYGCENDCVYCFAKLIGYDQGWAESGQWHNPILRKDQVGKGLSAAASKCIKIAEIKMHDLFDEAVWVAGDDGGRPRR